MSSWSQRTGAALALLTLVALGTTGCFGGSGGTKAGGKALRQLTLVMQTPDAPDDDATYFAAQVRERTHGRIRIVEANDYSSCDADNEARLVRALRSGKEQLAYIPARAWERASDVTAFRALQAPFLVTDYDLLRRIASGPIGASMLDSLGRIGLVGLGLVPNELRRALGRKPLDSTAAFRGARIRIVTSPTTTIGIRALGAIPLTDFDCHAVTRALRNGPIDGIEGSTHSIESNSYTAGAPYLTSNLALFAKAQTIAIRRDAFLRLDARDRTALRAAAAATVAHADPADQERAEVARLCNKGLRLVPASPADLASLRRAAAPAYAILRRDPVTRRELAAVVRLRGQTSAAAAALPACRRDGQTAPAPGKTTGVDIEGTYSMSASNGEIEAAPRHEPGLVDNWGSFTLVLRSGRFRFFDHRPADAQPSVGCRNGGGTCASGWTTGRYVIGGGQITFIQEAGAGDTPMGQRGDNPIVCRWSLYRRAITFHLIPNLAAAYDSGPPLLYVKPWRRTR